MNFVQWIAVKSVPSKTITSDAMGVSSCILMSSKMYCVQIVTINFLLIQTHTSLQQISNNHPYQKRTDLDLIVEKLWHDAHLVLILAKQQLLYKNITITMYSLSIFFSRNTYVTFETFNNTWLLGSVTYKSGSISLTA